ncbi:MAG TPA: PAS domain S-box protein, partial [Steroidobacter sp.]|nr:PAS domain S-box protein [Steroidobacter sp.]
MLRRLLGAFGRRIGRAAGGESRSPPSQESAAWDPAVQDSIQAQVEASRAELERASARLKLYLERAPLACVVWDMAGVVREWNPAAEQIFGYTAV